MSRRNLGSSNLNKSWVNFVLVVFSKPSGSVVRVIQLVGHTPNSLNGQLSSNDFETNAHNVCHLLRYYMLVPATTWEPMIKSLDLNRLCAIILENTIADADMYQNGLTKIFFRAGMLAALESLRTGKLNALVTIVQKNMRRKIALVKYQKLRHATIVIQTRWRGILARRLAERMRREASAIKIQVAVRRYVQRKRFLDIKRGVTLLQARKCDTI